MVVDELREAALNLLAALKPPQRKAITAPFDTPDHQRWTYLPGDRPGLTLAELDAEQRQLAMRLIQLACSERGLADATSVLFAEAIRRDLPQAQPGSTLDVGADQHYYLRILGDPAGPEPWAWRINGHHLALHLTLVDGAIALTPQFFGSEPGQGHYYSVAGPTFLAEYDNTQDDANHIHSVWRDLRNDWARDLLAAHYALHQP